MTSGDNEKKWTEIGPEGDSNSSSVISNSQCPLPIGLRAIHDFVTQEEVDELLFQVDQERFIWEGFEQRKRIQRYDLSDDDSNLPSSLRRIRDRLVLMTGLSPQCIVVEEFPRSQLSKHLNTTNSHVTIFESKKLCQCQDNCTCFVAQLPICSPVVQFLNRPRIRSNACWDWYSPKHWTDLMMSSRSLFIKSKDCLWDWRCRISSMAREFHENDRFVIVRFFRLPEDSEQDDLDSKFGYVASEETFTLRGDLPPLQDILTIVITTSPIKSNPSTELLERVFETFYMGGEDFALKCRKVIVCDGCRTKDESVSNRHVNSKQAMRNGIVSSEQRDRYIEFKNALRKLCASAQPDSPFFNSDVEELKDRHGYGFALRHALRHCVKTPFVIVIQHDRTFMRPTPIRETLNAMWHHPNIKYVGMSMRSNLMYRDIFLGKYGKSYHDEMRQCTLRLPELVLDAKLYGPDSHSTQNMNYSEQPKLRENIMALVETYRGSQQNVDHLEWIGANPLASGTVQLSLTPTFFWYDNVHICETAHYSDFVFHPSYKMVARGGFVEDKLSPVIKKTVERLGLAKGHARFGCFLLDDHSGMFFTGHLDGGSYLTNEQKQSIVVSKEMTM